LSDCYWTFFPKAEGEIITLQRMKNDLTTGAWQQDIGCPISIVLLSTFDAAYANTANMTMASLGFTILFRNKDNIIGLHFGSS
jgi:hypothetical protein